jgi:hypothetical protein
MIRRTMLSVAAALTLGACTALPPLPTASLPYDAVIGAGDPLRTAVANTANAFSAPDRLAGQPARAARALAQMEYLAVELPDNARLGALAPASGQFELARREWREALGIPADLPPQPVIDALYASARALSAGQSEAAAAALPASTFRQGGAATLMRLASLPSLPLTNRAAVAANDALRRHDGQGRGRF